MAEFQRKKFIKLYLGCTVIYIDNLNKNRRLLYMQNTVNIECPPELLLSLHLNVEGFADYLKRQAAISLYKEGKISSGTASSWLGIDRVAFLSLTFGAGATLLDDTADDFARETALL
jgi:hypothetical protein